jgi:hypothetical protein
LDRLRVQPADIVVEDYSTQEISPKVAACEGRERGGWIGMVLEYQRRPEWDSFICQGLHVIAADDQFGTDVVVGVDEPGVSKLFAQCDKRVTHAFKAPAPVSPAGASLIEIARPDGRADEVYDQAACSDGGDTVDIALWRDLDNVHPDHPAFIHQSLD